MFYQVIRTKRRQLLTLLLLLLASPLVAQQYFPHGDHSSPENEHGARWVFGGLVSYWQDNKAKTTHLQLAPEVAYLFNDNWGLGVVGSYELEKKGSDKESLWALRPFVRYYYMHREPFNLST